MSNQTWLLNGDAPLAAIQNPAKHIRSVDHQLIDRPLERGVLEYSLIILPYILYSIYIIIYTIYHKVDTIYYIVSAI